MSNEEFIVKWEKSRKKGQIKFVFTASVFPSLIALLGLIIGTVTKEGNLLIALTKDSTSILPILFTGAIIGGLIGGGVGALSRWSRNEEKYNKLVRR